MKKAFTLVEIIVTLSIISVIAALTIPSVMKTYRQKIYSAQLKKVVSQIETAAKTAMSEEHSQSFFQTNSGIKDTANGTQGSQYFLKNYFKISAGKTSNCLTESVKCVPASYKTADGTNAGTMFGYCVQTVNGAVICMKNDDNSNTSYIGIDVNGIDAPNIVGTDVFTMVINPDGSLSDSSANAASCGKVSGSGETLLRYASGCFQKVLNNNWKIEE